MRDPVVTECLHRFCKECIERCQRQAFQCPSCRKPIGTRRLLRPDPNTAALIAKLYPDIDAFEAEEERQMLVDNAKRTKEHAAEMRVARQRQKAMRAKYEADARHGRIAKPRVELEVLMPRAHEMGFRLQRHPLEAQLSELLRDYVVVSCLATVGQIQRLLARSFALDAADKECWRAFQLHVVLPNLNLSPLPSDASLHEVVQKHHLESSAIEFRYRFDGELPS